MGKAKIAVFIGDVTSEFQVEIIKSILEEAKIKEFQTTFFCVSSEYGANVWGAAGEKNIITLPDPDLYEGIIVMVDTIQINHMKDELLGKLKGCKCPVISVRGEHETEFNVLVDNADGIAQITEHFINDHKFSDICYLGGTYEMTDAQERYKSFVKTMKAHGLRVDDSMIFHGTFWKHCVPDALDFFMKDRENGDYPQAIICANDYMATAMVNELGKRGIRVPQDICVSGFDDIVDCVLCEPTVTSIAVSFRDMGIKCVDQIAAFRDGKVIEKNVTVPAKLIFRESCGCKHSKTQVFHTRYRELYSKHIDIKNLIDVHNFMTIEYEEALDENEMIAAFANYAKYNEDMRRIYVCLCDEEERKFEEEEMYDKYTSQMVLRTIFYPDGRYEMPMSKFPKAKIVPEEYSENEEALFVVPLHFRNHCHGYLVITFDKPRSLNQFFKMWSNSFANMLENRYHMGRLKIVDELEKNAMHDELTGLFNRRAYADYSRRFFQRAIAQDKSVFFITLDMDGLKIINDGYGHQEGDFGLKTVAEALTMAAEEGEIVCRTGGDEFAVTAFDRTAEEMNAFVSRFQDCLKILNKKYEKPYEVGASIGCYIGYPASERELAEYIHQSDQNMYADKKRRGKRRQ